MEARVESENTVEKTTEALEEQPQSEMEKDISGEYLNENQSLSKVVPPEQRVEENSDATPVTARDSTSVQLLYMTQLVAELSEGVISSDFEQKFDYTFAPFSDATSMQSTLANCSSAESCNTQTPASFSNSEQQLLLIPLDESYTLLDKIDMSGTLSTGNEVFQNSNIEEKLLHLMQQPENWDVKVYIREHKFYCQLVILQMFSPYFLRCKLESTDAIRLPEQLVTPRAFSVVYHWMLEEDPVIGKDLSNRCLLEVYNAAKYLGITELMDFICNTLDTVKHDNDGFALLKDMSDLDMHDFQCLFLSRIGKFFLTLASSREFVELPYVFIKHLLGSNNLGVNSEIEVFYALVRWLSYKWPQRQSHVTSLVECIRFGLLPPMFLYFLQNPQTTRVMHYINSVPEVKDMIKKAFVFTSAERYCKDSPEQLLRQLPNYVIPEPRKWIIDSKCPYHHSLQCSQRQFFTYDQFLGYLEMLHYLKPNHWKKLKYLDAATVCCPR